MAEMKNRSISLIFGKVNLCLTAFLFLFVVGWLIFSLVMNRMAFAKEEFLLLQLSYLIIGIYLLLPIIAGIFIGLYELTSKKQTKGLYINLILLIFWGLFLIWSFLFYK